MATAVILPKQGNSVESCIIQSWLKQPGDAVKAGEAICEVETDKATVEVEAPCDGTLIELFWAEDDDVPVLVNIAAIGDAGEDVSALRPADAGGAAEAAPAAEEAPAAAAPTAAAPAAAAPAAAASAGAGGSSPRARSLAAGEALTLDGIVGSGPDGRIIERDVEAALAGRAKLSPAAKEALTANPSLVVPARGSGPDGLVLAEDLQAAAAAPAAASVAVAVPGSVTEIKVKGVRKVIAERMMASLQGSAQLTLNTSFDASSIQAWRANYKANAEALGLPKITINDLIIFAVSRILPKFPELNAHWLGDKIVQFGDANIGVAVDTPKGLLVPVIPQANRKSLADLASEFRPLAMSCIEGNVQPERLSGGTFTITNLGAMGIESFTPVLNVPEVAILGVSAPTVQPSRGKNGEVEFVDRIGLSLTIDHQATDGAPGARFLQTLVKALENLDLILAV
ncbi:MAG: dihydrolipoamide acetyltransferase family protein [Planctomycetota bacterium]|jgi:pyruvate dehydrogenase E2 component (dihydrolipoamide acetyltransferase)